MLVIQIALGIVLAAVILRFWRQSLWITAGLLGLALVAVLVLWATKDGAYVESTIVVAVSIFLASAIRGWRQRHQIRNGPPS